MGLRLHKYGNEQGPIFITDDDASFRTCLANSLTSHGYIVDTLPDGNELLARLNRGEIPSLILLDVILPGNDGLQLIDKIKALAPPVPVIMLSGVDQVRTVVEAMKLGAADFLLKPFEDSALQAAIDSALAAGAVHVETGSGEFVSVNFRMQRAAEIVRRVAQLNCAALPASLIESELFGHEQGAFTGDLSSRTGKFEQAHTGSILLDEIGEMTRHLQSKLLKVLQDGTFSRLGGRKTIHVDARIIASTNVKTEDAVASGKFREDLYFRLNVISVDLPPLRERREDIPGLCTYFIRQYRERYNSDAQELSPELLEYFVRYDWPGNVRELENFIRRFLVLSDEHSLMTELNPPKPTPGGTEVVVTQPTFLLDVGANAADRAEQELVRRVLLETHGNRKQAAKRLKISYKSLLNKMKRWNERHDQRLPPIGQLVT